MQRGSMRAGRPLSLVRSPESLKLLLAAAAGASLELTGVGLDAQLHCKAFELHGFGARASRFRELSGDFLGVLHRGRVRLRRGVAELDRGAGAPGLGGGRLDRGGSTAAEVGSAWTVVGTAWTSAGSAWTFGAGGPGRGPVRLDLGGPLRAVVQVGCTAVQSAQTSAAPASLPALGLGQLAVG